ncbi:DNA polymerase III subunit [Paraliomyxa miuraensis]|uniref:DNA polymerase III subunit n=1 Tax=Paraliomyxa miuraensis TaxID=376150 RepID=UPI0022503CB4|nr:AAA family ATPase [Paraliomyxa miuraensis]MCX4239820.1 AAA family ATPase [Paraliomyxa miuraensis]
MPPATEQASPRFPGVVGHAHAQARLSRAIARDQLHHGLIFMGPRGIGKATLARGLACALHCPQQPAVGCGTCTVCHRILTNVHAGVEWVMPEEPGGTIKVDTARELAHRLQHAPFEGRHHVVVLDPADALTEQAYNALLKSIEEPKPGVCFVMVTTHPQGLLPTILSRCLPVRLGPLAQPELEQVLDAVLRERQAAAEAEGQPPFELPDPTRRALAVRLGQGSVGRALDLLVDASLADVLALVRCGMEAVAEGPAGIFGGDKGPLWSAWTQASGGSGPGRPARERAACGRAVDLWLLHLREHLRGESGLPGLPPPAGTTDDVPRLLHQIDRLQALRESLLRNPNVRLSIEQTLLELSR